MSKKLNISKEFLVKEYIINKKSTTQIAEEVGYSKSTIWFYLKLYNIPIRIISESLKGKRKNSKYSKILTKEFLYEEYIINKKSCNQIAKETNISDVVIWDNLKKQDINVRTNLVATLLKSNITNILTKDFLYQEYVINKKSSLQIAQITRSFLNEGIYQEN